jgi:predicted HTH transcriptional regulator
MLDVIENAMYQYTDGGINHVDPVNDPVKFQNDPVNSFDVIELIKQDPYISYDKLVELTGRSRATIKRMIKRLKQEGYIAREGSDKNGFWKIIRTNI